MVNFEKEVERMPVLAQLCLIFGICLFSEGVAAVLPFPFPSSVISMLLLLLLFAAKIIKPAQLKESSGFLLDHMALFFLPACVSLMQYADVLFANFWVIVGISLLTTPLVFFITGQAVQLTIRLMKRKERAER